MSKRNMLLNIWIMGISASVFSVVAAGFNGHGKYVPMLLLTDNMTPQGDIVTYEAFGAVGDGVHDDLPAICKAHDYANAHGLPVISEPDATYHLGKKALTSIIATDTNWSTSHFIIDDTDVENHNKSLFEVRSLLTTEDINIEKLTRDQKQLNV